MDNRLRQNRRLRRRHEFQRVYDRGFRTHGRLMTVFLLPTDSDVTRLGIAATRKLGGAVERNRAKRLVREIFRHYRHPPGLDVVVIPRPPLLAAPLGEIEVDYASCLSRGGRRGRSR